MDDKFVCFPFPNDYTQNITISSFDTQLNETTNQNSFKVPEFFQPNKKKTYL